MAHAIGSFVGVVSILAATQAAAEDLTPAHSRHGPPHAAVSKAAKPRSRGSGSGLAGTPFSDPYAPPIGAGAGPGPGAEFPAAHRAVPVAPKGDLSLTYKWKANNDPVDPYWNIRSAPGSEAPGDSFLGGLKLGF